MTTHADDTQSAQQQGYPPQPSERLWDLSYRLHRVRGESSAKTMDILTELESLRVALNRGVQFPALRYWLFLSLIEQALDRMGVPTRPTNNSSRPKRSKTQQTCRWFTPGS